MTSSDPRSPEALVPRGDDAGRGIEPRTIGPRELFVAFSQLALSGFGGVLPFAYRTLVERRKWIDARDFASLLAIAQVMPGPTICNLSVMIGQRYAGFAGSCAALAGMVAGPSCIVIALGIAWQRYGDLDAVRHALAGMSAVAIGLIVATGVKMAVGLFRRDAKAAEAGYWSMRRLTQVVLCVLAFAGVGLLRWPLVAVVGGLAPFAIAVAWFHAPDAS